jgi:flagellar biosynthesis protein FlhA
VKNRNLAKLAVPVGVVGIVLLLVVPIPAFVLDVLIIINILLALVILLTTMFVRKPLDFSVFPSLLLVATLFRLGLNVASTRLVLGKGYAGDVIGAFGHVAVGGSIIIGAVIFLILSTPGSSPTCRPASAERRSLPRPTSTVQWTAPPSSSKATRSPAS